MSEYSSSLSKWFSERPKWLQMTSKLLLDQGNIAPKEILNLASLCQLEVDGKLTQGDCTFPTSAFDANAIGNLRLCSISNIEGVNALAPRKSLDFGKSNIAVVYGHNGSGKSGYVRLLKHICGARNLGTLHRNVYSTAPKIQKAMISFEKDGIAASHDWTGQGICEELGSVDIFDTSFGRVFVNSEDEVSYEPPVLSFFSSLIEICEKVASELDNEASRHQSKKPNIPADLKVSPEGIWFENITAKTTPDEVNKYCCFSREDNKEAQTLQQRLAEQAPADKAKLLKTQKAHVDSLVQDAKKYLVQLSDENCRRIFAAKKKSILKKTAAETAAQQVFRGGLLEGIGSDVWAELWSAARKYSVSQAYKNHDYPNVSEESHCVLCHQPLSEEAKMRLVSFEEFVKGDTRKSSELAYKRFDTVIQLIEKLNLPKLKDLRTRIDAAGLQQDEFITTPLAEFFSQLLERKEKLPSLEFEDAIPAIPQSSKWIEDAKTLSNSWGELAEKYETDGQNDNRDAIKKSLNSLRSKKWLSEHREAIQEEINRLKLLEKIKEARASTNTTALSRKKGELAEALITDAFVQRFNAELKALGASRIKVELVKSKVSKGRVLHKLQLRGAAQSSLSEVLSEGESRIVSIASFLADVTSKDYSAPFVFDDPISSLDQDFEESVVQRLTILSSNRQVIIFTHRLSLLGLVQDYAKKTDIEPEIVCIREENWGTGEPGETPLFVKKPDKALNYLINDRLSKAQKVLKEYGKEVYDPYAKALCSDFRILIERMIECELICDVVQRYRRAINTMGKIEHLAKITELDCKLFDELMTKYSRYEHSQPLEAPVSLPDPDELETDFKALKQWQDSFRARPIKSSGQQA